MRTVARIMLIVALIVVVGPTVPAAAQPLSPCTVRAARLDDMAGPYEAPVPLPAVAIDRCGLVGITWDDAAGRQRARYVAAARIPSGGFTAYAESDDGPYLDDVRFLLVKPAEPGFIQVWTLDVYGNIVNVYRLARIT